MNMCLKTLAIVIFSVGVMVPNVAFTQSFCGDVFLTWANNNTKQIKKKFRSRFFIPHFRDLRDNLKFGINAVLQARADKVQMEIARDRAQKQVRGFGEFLAASETTDKLDFSKHTWAENYILPYHKLGSSRLNLDVGSYEVLFSWRAYFERYLDGSFVEMAVAAMDKLTNAELVGEWIQNLRMDVLYLMWQEGIQPEDVKRSYEINEYYLDRILARRALKLGFQVTGSELPFSIFTFYEDGNSLYRQLSQRRLFNDWYGLFLEDIHGEVSHSVRGHSLQLVYVAEHVPNFINFVEFMGNMDVGTNIWYTIFDNAQSPRTPTAPEHWMETFKRFLRIRY